MTTPVIDLRDAVVGYTGRPVLSGLSVTVAPGEVLALLGANGSGKSTLVRAMLGLLPVAAGTVHLFGTPLPRFRERHRIGYVPQRHGAGAGVPATVTEVVNSGRLARRRGWAADRRAVAEAIATVGLTERRRDPVSTLSGGQQQRTLIARALASEPELLVLDEPTAGVDAASQVAFAAAVSRFVEGGGTLVLVTHELGPLEPLVTRAIVLHHGRVVHDGPVPPSASYHAGAYHDHAHPPRDSDIWQGSPA